MENGKGTGASVRTEADLRAFYEQTLKPALRALDRERCTVRNRLMVLWIATGLALIAAFAVGSKVETMDLSEGVLTVVGAVTGIGLFAAWFIVYGWTRRKAAQFLARFKENVIGQVVRFIEPALEYDPDGCISPETFDRSGLFPLHYDKYAGDDRVHGTIGRTPLEFSEVHTRVNVAAEEARPKYRTQFHGLFFVCEFNKTFQGRTYVLPDRLKSALGDLGAALQRSKTRYGGKVTLEDPEFGRMFTVYGTDQIVSRYVLSLSLMERLKAFRKKTRQPLRLAFVDSDLFAAISFDRDLFEPRVWRTLVNYAAVRTVFEDLQFVIGIVEDLNLNTRIWGERAMKPAPDEEPAASTGSEDQGVEPEPGEYEEYGEP
jgi:hypothetical protein